MRHFIIPTLLLMFGTNLSSCVHSRVNELEATLSAWHGHSPDSLVEAWGAPTSAYTMSDQRKVLSYQHDRVKTRSLFYYYPETYADSYTCKISFYTNAEQTEIVSHKYLGDPYTCFDIATAPAKEAESP